MTTVTAANIGAVRWVTPRGVASFASQARTFGIVDDQGRVLARQSTGEPMTWTRLGIARQIAEHRGWPASDEAWITPVA